MSPPVDELELSTPAVKANGTALPALWLNAMVSLRVERGLCLVSRAQLRFSDPGYVLSAKSLFGLGAQVEIALGTGPSLFEGTVTGTSLEQSASAHPELIVTVDDAAYKLGLGTNVQNYVQSSYGDVIKTIAARAGLTPNVSGGSEMTAQHDYLLQTGSDLAMLDELTRRSGSVWWVDGKKLVVRAVTDSASVATLTMGQELTQFSVRASGLRPTEIKVNGWDGKAQTDVTGTGTSPQKTLTADFAQDFLATSPGSKLVKSKVAVGTGNPNNQQEAVGLATSMNADMEASAVVAKGTVWANAKVSPLSKVTVANVGPASGSYVVSSVEHVYAHDGFRTRFTAGPIRPTGLVDTLGRAPRDPGFAIAGLYTARVSNVQDPDKLGRVRVSYAGTADQLESAWARVVSLGGGANRGTVFQPEVGDEVLVGFERGDTRHPVVIGGLYGQKATIAADDKLLGSGNKISYRRITSRLGHVIELSDGEGPAEQHVLIKLNNGTHLIRVGADKLDIETAAGKPISMKSGSAGITIDAGGNISITAKRIDIKADVDISVAGKTIGVKADAQVQVESSAALALKGATAQLQASGPVAIKGAMVAIN